VTKPPALEDARHAAPDGLPGPADAFLAAPDLPFGPPADPARDRSDAFDPGAAGHGLVQSVEFVARVADASPLLIYVFDLVLDRLVYCNQALHSMLGYSPDDLHRMGSSLMWTLLHPDDRIAISETRAQIAAAADDEAIESEYRVRHADGSWRWLAAREVVFLRDDAGRPRQVLGTVMDVTDRKRTELALRESQHRYELAAAAGRVAVWDCDLARGQMWSEPSLAELLGYAPGEPEIATDWKDRVHPDDRERVLRHRAQVYAPDAPRDAEGNTPCPEIEYRAVGRLGAVRWLADRGTIMRRPDGEPYRAVGTITDITERKHAEDELRRITGEILRAQDAERRSIAGDLHDGVAQDLAAIAVNLLRLDQQAGVLPPEARSVLTATQELAERSLRGLRTLSYLLHPPLLDHAGLAVAICDYAQGFAKRTGIAVDVSAVAQISPLPRDAELALYRVVQECLVNVQRHAGSAAAAIGLTTDEDGILLQVRDHGRGLGWRAGNEQAGDAGHIGVGIASMRERVRHLGGHLVIASGPSGTTVSARMPLPPEGGGRATP
jgi:PAS domain S-box-containing protein